MERLLCLPLMIVGSNLLLAQPPVPRYEVKRAAVPIVIDGKLGSLAALPAGANVNLALHVDQKTVGMIYAKAP